jgi:hypothetical protein
MDKSKDIAPNQCLRAIDEQGGWRIVQENQSLWIKLARKVAQGFTNCLTIQ